MPACRGCARCGRSGAGLPERPLPRPFEPFTGPSRLIKTARIWRDDMRLPTSVMVVCMVMAAAAPAFAARQANRDDCRAKDPDRSIAGSNLIIDGGESERNHALAYV